ncbi:MAG: phage integrase SAM-like domain-containing protein [Planctomycetota bacterium]
MASISSAKGGIRRLQFADPISKRRQTVYLGRMAMSNARTVKVWTENLIAAKGSNSSLDAQTLAWVNGLGDDIHAKLSAVGLVGERGAATLGTFTANYISGRTDIKWRTTRNLNASRKYLIDHFGADCSMREITEGDADEFLIAMKSQGYANATIGRTIKRCRQFWKSAMRRKIVASNPFSTVKAPSERNATRMFFITLEMASKVLAACPNAEWRLIFALARFGGLRIPSELQGLRWTDILWDSNRIRVRSPKKASDEHGGERYLPIFPELKEHLNAAWDRAEDGAEFVIRPSDSPLGPTMNRIIERAGLTPWPKTFQNLRSTRETELLATCPVHVVVSWLGNSAAVAMAHYAQVTDADFAKASEGNANCNATLTQNATQPVIASSIQDEAESEESEDFPASCPVLATADDPSQYDLSPPGGVSFCA